MRCVVTATWSFFGQRASVWPERDWIASARWVAAETNYIVLLSHHVTSLEAWSFRKTETVGTLASQAEICVWVQAPGRYYGGPEYHPPKKFWDCIMYMQNPAKNMHFGRKMVSTAVYNAFLNTAKRVPLEISRLTIFQWLRLWDF